MQWNSKNKEELSPLGDTLHWGDSILTEVWDEYKFTR